MIFYFSGTGNTRWVAERLGEATGERVINMAAVLDDDATYRLAEGERLGFCFPVHGWRPPFVVRDFIRRLRLEGAEGSYVYGFATCGDDVGRTFEYLDDDLAAIGLRAASVFSLIMPESHVFPLVDLLDTPEKAAEKKRAAREALAALIPYIYNKVSGLRRINESRWPRTNSWLLGAFFRRYWVSDRPFRVSRERCQHCGRCSMACPVRNIKMQDGVPTWLHNGRCTTCFSCYHHCDAHAIDFGRRTKPTTRQYYFTRNSSTDKQ